MNHISLVLTLICLACEVASDSLISPCKVTDLTCIEKTVNAALPQIFDGIPELGIESSDPQFNEIITGNPSGFKFTLFNSTTTGYKSCIVSNIKLNEDITTIHCNVMCPMLTMKGHWEMDGYLIELPVQGKGTYQFIGDKYFLLLDIEMEKVSGSDGKAHLFIKNFKVNAKPHYVKYKFNNNEHKDLVDTVDKYTQEHWKEVTELIQHPIWISSLNIVMTNLNKYLKNISIEDILLN